MQVLVLAQVLAADGGAWFCGHVSSLKPMRRFCIWFRNAAQDARLVTTRADRCTGAKMGKGADIASPFQRFCGVRARERRGGLHGCTLDTKAKRLAHGAVACSLAIV
jgi:hypothetical protein